MASCFSVSTSSPVLRPPAGVSSTLRVITSLKAARWNKWTPKTRADWQWLVVILGFNLLQSVIICIYSAFREYSDLFAFFTFCYVAVWRSLHTGGVWRFNGTKMQNICLGLLLWKVRTEGVDLVCAAFVEVQRSNKVCQCSALIWYE